MNAGQLLLVTKDIIALLEERGILLTSGAFDEAKLDTVQEDVAFAQAIEVVLAKHGVNVPHRVDAILQIIPLLAMVIK